MGIREREQVVKERHLRKIVERAQERVGQQEQLERQDERRDERSEHQADVQVVDLVGRHVEWDGSERPEDNAHAGAEGGRLRGFGENPAVTVLDDSRELKHAIVHREVDARREHLHC